MSSVDELVKLWGKDVNPDPKVLEKTVREVLEFALIAAERQASVVFIGACRNPRRIRIYGHDVNRGLIMVRLLGKEVHPSVHLQTVRCLADLAVSSENQIKLGSYSGVLDALVSLLGKAGDAVLHEHTARCLAELAESQENHFQMASSGVLGPLVKGLEKDGLPIVHQHIARCLINLAASKENLLERIAFYPGTLDALVRLLNTRRSSELHQIAARCLTTLAKSKDTQLKIVSDNSGPSGVKALVDLLGKNTSTVQRQSLKCLTTLSDHYRQNKVDIASYPGVLDALVSLLKCNWITTGRISVQVEAARCLLKLVSAPENLEKIVLHRDALNALVRCLDTKWRTRKVQALAAQCFNSLAAAPENLGIQIRIVRYPGAVSAIMNQMVQDLNPSGQAMAACCLSKLAMAQETKEFLTCYPRLLNTLISLLRNSSSATLEPTIRCLAFLAQSVSVENKVRIASHPGVMDSLLRLLSLSTLDVHSLEEAAKCLSYLALAPENVQKIFSSPGFLGALMNLLEEDGNPEVVQYAAKCLTNLACSQENQVKIVSFPGMLNALVSFLSPSVQLTSGVLQQILRYLAQLLTAPENQAKIGSYPDVENALEMLADDEDSSTQEQAAVCLAKLNLGARAAVEHYSIITSPRSQRPGDSQRLSNPDHWAVDPITWTVMSDPVKCNDGFTYDRWTIIESGVHRSPYDRDLKPFDIVCSDIDVRKRLFRKFPRQEAKFRARREKYRQEALQHSLTLECDDAIEKLKNVLNWAPSDTECKNELTRILNQVSEQPPEQILLPESPSHDGPLEVPVHLDELNLPSRIPIPLPQHQIQAIPAINHGKLVSVREREGRQMILVFVAIYLIWFFLTT